MSNIHDVARVANVAVSTVSRAFNNYKDINIDTKERILKVAKELNYVPNQSAIALVSKPRDTIGFISADIGFDHTNNEYVLGLISGVYHEAEKEGLQVMMFSIGSLLSKNLDYVKFCKAHNLIGIILHGLDYNDNKVSLLLNSEYPSIFVDMNVSGTRSANVSIDNYQATYDVVKKMIAYNHKSILYLAGRSCAYVSIERTRGFLDAIKDPKVKHFSLINADFIKDTAYQETYQYLKDHQDKKIDCIICASDLMAVGVYDACRDLNIRIPEDISVFGFDNMSFTQYLHPQLSTVAQDFFAIGKSSVNLLATSIKDNIFKNRNIDYDLIVRDSIKIREIKNELK